MPANRIEASPTMEFPANTSSRIEWLAPAVVSLVCVSPFLIFWHRIQTFYWFDDDWDMLSELQSLGLGRWMQQPFGENFVPLFKALWAGAIPLVGGSYFGMIGLLWMTHLAILLLFAAVLRRVGLSWPAQSLAVLTLGMPWSNIEVLGWGLLLGYPWARHSARWAQWRGQNVKDAVASVPADQRFGNPWTTAGRARELIQIYHLH